MKFLNVSAIAPLRVPGCAGKDWKGGESTRKGKGARVGGALLCCSASPHGMRSMVLEWAAGLQHRVRNPGYNNTKSAFADCGLGIDGGSRNPRLRRIV